MHYAIGQILPYEPSPIYRDGECRWHALLVFPQREAAAKAWLAHRDVYAFFPVTSAWRIRPKARITKVHYWRKYLPGYLFAHFPGEPVWYRVFNGIFIRDAIRMNSGQPGHLHEETLESLKAMRSTEEALEEQRRLRKLITKGDRARIKDGPMEGWEIEVHEINTSTGKATFPLKLLGQSYAEIEIHRLEKLG